MALIKSGKKKDRVELISLTQTPTATGITSVEVSQGTVWADVVPMKGSRSLQAGEIVGGKPYEVVLDLNDVPGISEDWIIRYNSRDLTIHSITFEDGWTVRVTAFDRVV